MKVILMTLLIVFYSLNSSAKPLDEGKAWERFGDSDRTIATSASGENMSNYTIVLSELVDGNMRTKFLITGEKNCTYKGQELIRTFIVNGEPVKMIGNCMADDGGTGIMYSPTSQKGHEYVFNEFKNKEEVELQGYPIISARGYASEYKRILKNNPARWIEYNLVTSYTQNNPNMMVHLKRFGNSVHLLFILSNDDCSIEHENKKTETLKVNGQYVDFLAGCMKDTGGKRLYIGKTRQGNNYLINEFKKMNNVRVGEFGLSTTKGFNKEYERLLEVSKAL